MNNIKDKVVIVTGASSGMGAEIAKQLGEKGAKLVLAARREENLKLSPVDMARAVVYAINEPDNISINEIIVQPTNA